MKVLNNQTRQYNKGYSLLELMFVGILLGILMAITYPSYNEHLKQTRRSDAKTALVNISQQQQRFYTENLNYAPNFKLLLNEADETLLTPNGLYRLSLIATQKDGSHCDISKRNCIRFTVTATPIAGKQQETDSTCSKLGINNSMNYTSEDNNQDDTSAKCWNL